MRPIIIVVVLISAALRTGHHTQHGVHAAISGYYADNGRGQTAIQRHLTVDETRQFEYQLLNVLGLADLPAALRPNTKRRNLNVSSMRRRSAPAFLLHLYHRQQQLEQQQHDEDDDDDDDIGIPNGLHHHHKRDVRDTADTIMTFLGHRRTRHRRPPKVVLQQLLWFDVTATSTISNGAELLLSELHLYKKIPVDRENDVSASPDDTYLIQVHDTFDDCRTVEAQPPAHRRPKARQRRLIASARIAWDRCGWLRLNVTGVFERWRRQYHHPSSVPIRAVRCRLFVSVQQRQRHENSVDEDDGLVMRPLSDAGVVMSNGAFQPFVVGYLQDNEHRWHHYGRRRRQKRSGDDDEDDDEYDEDEGETEDDDDNPMAGSDLPLRRQRRHNIHNQPRRRRKLRPMTRRRNPLLEPRIMDTVRICQRQALYISFRNLTWQDWVISPSGYEAFYCSGDCVYPLTALLNATNHATVQTLMHLLHPTLVPRPNCAPTKFGSFRVLYYLDDWNVNLKTYRETVVLSCGCQ